MTLLAEPTGAVRGDRGQPGAPLTLAGLGAALRRPGARAGVAETLLVLPALLWWALPLTHATGGRDPFGLAVEIALLAVAAGATRPWRRLPLPVTLLGGWLGVAAISVCALAPTGWAGADEASPYVAAGLALPVAAAWARTPARRVAAVTAIALAGLDQLVHALLPWWGGEDPSVRLSGTFYWYNPFAAYLLPAALLGLALIVWRTRPVQAAGWVAAPLCVAGVVLSTSRATLAVLAVGWLAVGVGTMLCPGSGALTCDGPGRARRGLRWLAASAVAVATTYALPGPPLFSHRVSPFGSTAARSTGGESLGTNGGYRVQFWREALTSFRHHPLTGSGYHGLVPASRPYVPGTWAASSYAHDGYLQALSDGGLLLAVPFLAACAALGVIALRRCWALVRRPGTMEPLVAVAAIALLGGMAHSAVDFDWSHSSVLLQAALLGGVVVAGGCVAGRVDNRRPAVRRGHPARAAAAVLLALAAVAGVATASALHRTRGDVEAAQLLPAPARAVALARAARAPLAADLAARRLLDLGFDTIPPTAAQLRTALRSTATAASDDEQLAAERALIQLHLGDRATAEATASRLLPDARRLASLAPVERQLLTALGRTADAATLPAPAAPAAPAAQTAAQTAAGSTP